jgi:hypothetical protein
MAAALIEHTKEQRPMIRVLFLEGVETSEMN